VNTPAPRPDRCPRCGGAFHCGAAGPDSCACTTITLGAALQAQLRERYDGCLCLDCLRALAPAAAAGVDLPAAGP